MHNPNIGIVRNPPLSDEKIDWKDEALGVINDVGKHVEHIEISQLLPVTDSNVYLNLTTLEGATYCIQLSSAGFHIVSNTYNSVTKQQQQSAESDNDVEMQTQEESTAMKHKAEVYETLHGFLDKVSPGYIQSFGTALANQLQAIQEMRTTIVEETKDGLKHQHDGNQADEEGDTKKMRFGAN